jgi:hypothetical protein
MRDCKVNLEDILDLVNCAEGYGFADDVFMDSMYQIAGDVSDEEISEFANILASQDGYSEEDREEEREDITERLTEWRDKHRGDE